MTGLGAFKDKGGRNNEENRIFNELNGYTNENGVDKITLLRIFNNSFRMSENGKKTLYEAEKPLMKKMVNSEIIKDNDKEILKNAIKNFKYYSEHKLPYDNNIKRYLTKEKIEYMYNNIHNMLDGKVTFRLDNNDIKKIKVINNLIDSTNNLTEDENKGAALLLNKAQISAHIVELLSYEDVANLGGLQTSLCLAQVISDSSFPDKRLMVHAIPPRLVNDEIEGLRKDKSGYNRETYINNLKTNIITYNTIELPELVHEFNMPPEMLNQFNKVANQRYKDLGMVKEESPEETIKNDNNSTPKPT